jgi:hypothetical protein
MTGLPPALSSDQQSRRDAEHLKLLSIFHFILAGFGLIGVAFVALHFAFVRTFFMNPAMWKNNKGGPPPEILMDVIPWIYAFAFVVILGGSLLNLLSGLFIRNRRHRMFSIVVGGLNCFHVPFGTALGVFTIVVLSRDSVRQVYEAPR